MKTSDNPNNKKYIGIKLIVLFCVLIIEGCSSYHFYYWQSNPNVPLFKEKNEFHGSLSEGGTLWGPTGIDVQAALALTDHIAVMTNYMSSKYDDFDPNDVSKHNYFEGAAGYFKPFNRFWVFDCVFEVYGGFGSCSQHHEYNDGIYRGKADLTFVKSFIQPSLGITSNALDIALSSSFSRLNFNKINNFVDQNSNYYDELEFIAMNRKFFLFEPAITLRGGWKFVKIQFQFLQSHHNRERDYGLNFEPGKFSFGIYISLSKKYWNDISKK